MRPTVSSPGALEIAESEEAVAGDGIGPDGVALELAAGGTPMVVPTASAASPVAVIRVDRRGAVLECRSRTPVHVNGRPVRELAIMRPGDGLVVGRARLVLRTVSAPEVPDPDVSGTAPSTVDAPSWPRAWLRCVAGRQAGQVRTVRESMGLPWSDLRDPPVARLSLESGRLVVRAIRHDGLAVDGHRVASALLRGGEQLVVGGEHYVLDGGLPVSLPSPPEEAPHEGVESARQVEELQVQAHEGAAFSPWWLLAAAAAIAGALVLLFGRL